MATTAFQAFRRPRKLEELPSAATGPVSPAVQLATGLRAVDGNLAPAQQSRTLLDGRLDVGPDSPLLGRRFRFLGVLGDGSSAQVILAEDVLLHGKLVALKIMKRHCSQLGLQELRALQYLHCSGAARGFVQLQGAFTEAGHLCLVLQRLQGSLLDCIASSAELPRSHHTSMLRSIASQLLVAVANMHARSLVHADLKPENVLLLPSEAGEDRGLAEVRLADLGSCFSTTGTDLHRVGFEAQTLPYRAPEVVLHQACAAAMDVWSLGCILAELSLHRPLFPASSASLLLQLMKEQLGNWQHESSAQHCDHAILGSHPGTVSMHSCHRTSVVHMQPREGEMASWQEDLSPLHRELLQAPGLPAEAAHLIMRMLHPLPAQRITAAQALMHPFLEPILPLASLQLALSQAATHAPAAAVAQLPAASHANQQPSARPHASRVSSAAAQSAQQAAGAEPRPQLVKPSAMRAGMGSAAQPSSALLQLQTSRGTPKSSTSHHVVPSIPSSKQHVPSTPMNQQHASKPDISSSLSIGSITPRPPQHATAAAAPSSSAVPPHARQRDSSAAPPPHVNAARSMSHGTSSAPQHHAAATQQQASPAKDRMQAASQHAAPEQRAEAADRSTGAQRSQHAGADQPCMPGWLDRAPACSTPAHASRDASEAETTPGEVATHGAWSAIREFVEAVSPPDEEGMPAANHALHSTAAAAARPDPNAQAAQHESLSQQYCYLQTHEPLVSLSLSAGHPAAHLIREDSQHQSDGRQRQRQQQQQPVVKLQQQEQASARSQPKSGSVNGLVPSGPEHSTPDAAASAFTGSFALPDSPDMPEVRLSADAQRCSLARAPDPGLAPHEQQQQLTTAPASCQPEDETASQHRDAAEGQPLTAEQQSAIAAQQASARKDDTLTGSADRAAADTLASLSMLSPARPRAARDAVAAGSRTPARKRRQNFKEPPRDLAKPEQNAPAKPKTPAALRKVLPPEVQPSSPPPVVGRTPAKRRKSSAAAARSPPLAVQTPSANHKRTADLQKVSLSEVQPRPAASELPGRRRKSNAAPATEDGPPEEAAGRKKPRLSAQPHAAAAMQPSPVRDKARPRSAAEQPAKSKPSEPKHSSPSQAGKAGRRAEQAAQQRVSSPREHPHSPEQAAQAVRSPQLESRALAADMQRAATAEADEHRQARGRSAKAGKPWWVV